MVEGFRDPTKKEIKEANECPSCEAFGICPSHKWLHDRQREMVATQKTREWFYGRKK